MYGVLGWKSKTHPNDVFVIEKPTSDDWMKADPHRYLAGWAQFNDTMGDGWTAHTPNGHVTAERINDYLSGLLEVLLGDREFIGDKAAGLKVLVAHWPKDVDAERVQWLCKLVGKDDGTHYHKTENKTSKAEKCKHDDRWLLVPTWAGKVGENDPGTTYALLHNGGATSDWGIHRAHEWCRIKYHTGVWGSLPKFYGHGATEATIDLLWATWCLVSAERNRELAARGLEAATHNLRLEGERKG